ncbi:MAG: hypothetical protein ACRDNB_02030 [Gaiellaceae bacterium]
MDESRVLARLDRIDALHRSGAAHCASGGHGELLAELRGLLCEAEELARAERQGADETKEVVGRLRTALARDIIGM